MPSRSNSEETVTDHRQDAEQPSPDRGESPNRGEKKEQSDIVEFDGPDDPMNPQNWPKKKKIGVTILYGMNTMCATFTSSIFSSASSFVARQFGISNEVGILGLSLFLLGFAFGPVLFAPLSELYGRRITIIVPMFIFICFSAAVATAANLQTIFICRFFSGVFSSSPVTIVGGGIADMFNQRERGGMVVIYSLCIVGGPLLAPTIGAAVSQSYLTWRWTEYLSVILTSFIVILDIIFLPETSAAIVLSKKASKLRMETGRWALHAKAEEKDHSLKGFAQTSLIQPLQMLVKEPMVLVITTYNGFTYGILYMLFAAIPIIFGEYRGWPVVTATLPNLATLVGTLIAAAINFVYSEKFFARYMDQHDGKAPPERRLPPMMLGAVTFPIGFFLIGWTSKPDIFWFPSFVGFVFIGMSFLLIFQSGIIYLIDAYTAKSASAIAANTFNRSLFGAGLPLVAEPLFHNLGVNWACTLLGCLAVVLGVTPYLFFVFGPRLRAMSKFAPGK